MELHEDSGSFIPDQHPLTTQTTTNAFGPSRRFWRVPAVATSTAVVAALCLYTGSAAHAAGTPTAAKVSALSLQPAAATTGTGGVHGAFNLYQGAGGGIEFWFNPTTGSLTVAIGTGTGALGGGVLGTYTYGTAPAAGTYLYADATLSAGTVLTLNLAGTYQLVNGVFIGSVSATVEGRTLTITSDGSSVFKASVAIAHGSAGWTSPTYAYTYYFDLEDLLRFIYPPIEIPTTYPDPDPDPYSLVDSDYADGGTTVYSDSTGTDGTVVSSDGTGDTSSSSSDDSSDDSSSGDDSGGGGGGGGTSDDDGAPIMEE